MRKNILLFSLLLTANHFFGQTQYIPGRIYFKIRNESSLILPEYERFKTSLSTFGNLPAIEKLVTHFPVMQIQQPFRSGNKNVTRIYRLELADDAQTTEVINYLNGLSYIAYAERAQRYRQSFVPNDVHSNQWYFPYIMGYGAWDISLGQPYIKVAIVDDACKIAHPDLSPIIYSNPNEIPANNIDDDLNGYIDDVNGWDASDNDGDPTPPNNIWLQLGAFTHGTHCSGIAGGATNNNQGIASIGNGISIVPVKCVADNSIFPLGIENGPEGIDYAITIGADVISLSWGGTFDSTVANLVNAALADSIIVVAAAGNNGDSSLLYPAALPGVLSVAASGRYDLVASFSQYGSTIDVVAPGDSIWSTLAGTNPYGWMSGTSMACPMTAGLCGLMLSNDSSWTPSMIINCLKSTCDNIEVCNPVLYTGNIGAGRINAHKALACMETNSPPVASMVPETYQLCFNTTNSLTFYDNSLWADSIRWNFPGGSPATSTLSTPQVTYPGTGLFTVQLIAYNGYGIDTTTIILTVLICNVGLPDHEPDHLVIYPNPSDGTLYIEQPRPGSHHIEMLNIAGQLVYSGDHTGNRIRVETSDLPAGWYTVLLRNEYGRFFGKFLRLGN